MTDQSPIRPRPGLEGLRPYQPRSDEPGITLRLDNNEAPSAVAELAAHALRQTTAEEIRRYPVPAPLEAQIAERYGVDPSRVIVTAGADDALARIMTAFLDRDRRLLSVVPTFEMIPVDARVAGADIIEVQWGTGDFPLDAILEAIEPGIGAVAVVTPNNPTGLVAPIDQLKQVALAARRVGAVLVVDVAYAEFAESDPTSQILDIDNVIVVRTLSKAWGLAGLRVGYAVAPRALADSVRVAGGPYPTSGPSLRAASVMLGSGEAIVRQVAETIVRERAVLTQILRSCGFEVTDSQANFVFARADHAADLSRTLKDDGILIRAFNKPGLEHAIRITCPGEPTDFDRLCRAIVRWARPSAILFDLDGVIADVSGSYRRAIADTCAHFGVRITSEQIETVKLEGNANNDWVVTHRLLTRAGIEVEYDAVTDEFERRYHGTPEQPGLSETETMLLAIDQLRAVTSTFPCAIVTGRPREDAAEFLDRFGLRECFNAIVCMEDAELPKPSPKPLQEALRRLRASGALDHNDANPVWMIGDTVDDLRAAIAQGVVPLGVRAPGAPPSSDDGLRAAGAALVRPHILELFDALLPNWKEAADGALR
jgi:histidinol-phosphate aminotransferase